MSGLAPNVYLVDEPGGVRLAPDLQVRIGGVSASPVEATGEHIYVRLRSALALGFHDLDVHSHGRDFHVADALEVIPDGVALDADELDAGHADVAVPDAGGLDADRLDAGDGADPGDSGVTDTGGVDGGTGDASVPAPLCPVDPALVGCWSLDGNALDGSGRGNDLTAAAVTYPAGGGVLLGAASGLVRARRPQLLHMRLSFDAWIRADAAPPPGGRMGIVDQEGEFGVFLSAASDLTCSAGALGAGSTPSPSPITIGVWHHVACVADMGRLTLYVDGRPIASTAAPGGRARDVDLHLGENAPLGDDQWIGAIDDARLWDRPRTSAEILADVATGRRIE